MLDLYKNIKNKRISLHMTQSELAQKVGYTNKSTIATIEAGKIDLPLSKINEFAKALNCTSDELMGTDGTIPEYVPGTVEVIDLYSKCTPEQRKAVLSFLRSFVN